MEQREESSPSAMTNTLVYSTLENLEDSLPPAQLGEASRLRGRSSIDQAQDLKNSITPPDSDVAAKETVEDVSVKLTTQTITGDAQFQVENCTQGSIPMRRISKIITQGVGSML